MKSGNVKPYHKKRGIAKEYNDIRFPLFVFITFLTIIGISANISYRPTIRKFEKVEYIRQ